jgi:hypothetical protein
MIEIPLDNSPEQVFSIRLENLVYRLRVTLNSRLAVWDIGFWRNDIPVVTGVALLGGIDILNQYNLALKNLFVVNTEGEPLDPTKENLGTGNRLILIPEDEFIELEFLDSIGNG